MTTIILIENGDLFEGTIDQFRDCFFSNASIESIKEWCKANGYRFQEV